jgi:hypothetical protein
MSKTNHQHKAVSSARENLHALASQLYARVSSGHDKLPYCVDAHGPAVVARGADGKLSPAFWQSGIGPWQRAKEQQPDGTLVDRHLNPWMVQRHLAGKYSIATTSPGWVEWVALDIDAHPDPRLSDIEGRIRAREQADAVLGQVWRVLGCNAERQPLVMHSPGGGYHVWFPLTREPVAGRSPGHNWPAAVARAWFERHLVEAGLTLAPGVLEVFPSGRALRLPCGRGMRLLQPRFPNDPDNLGLANWPETVRYQQAAGGLRVVRQIAATVQTFLTQWDAQRRTIADWLGRPAARWDAKWGFLGWREGEPAAADEKKYGAEITGDFCPSQQSDEVQGEPESLEAGFSGAGLAPIGPRLVSVDAVNRIKSHPPVAVKQSPTVGVGLLIRGDEFRVKVQGLLAEGVTHSSTRHDAVLTLSFYWGATCGLDLPQVLDRLRAWCGAHAHPGSRLDPREFLRDCIREASNYIRNFGSHWRFRGQGAGGGLATLATADAVVCDAVAPVVRDEVATILSWLASRADSAGHIGDPVQMASGLLARLCGDRRVLVDGKRRRATTIAIEELERLGVLTVAANYVVGRHGRMFLCWYQMGSGVLPRRETVNDAQWAALIPAYLPDPSPSAAPLAQTPPNALDAPHSASVTICVLGEKRVPEGTLQVLSDGLRGIPRTRLLPAADVGPDPNSASGRLPWYIRMYCQRAFTPGELRTADVSKVVPFPDLKRSRSGPHVAMQGPLHPAEAERRAVAALAWRGAG